MIEDMARVAVMAGRFAMALDNIDRLLSMPSRFSIDCSSWIRFGIRCGTFRGTGRWLSATRADFSDGASGRFFPDFPPGAE